MKTLSCSQCGQRVFFENTQCVACGATLGYVPTEGLMAAFAVSADGSWSRLGPAAAAQKPCHNYVSEQVCNWMLPSDDPAALCISCRTTHVIPALGNAANRGYWMLLEEAKRRLFYTLISLNLPRPDKTADPQHGLAFHFLEQVDPKARVLTGHDEGLITLNIAEADDTARERARHAMHEPYRTLLGHFRHESGHYYWDRLVNGTPWVDEYRAVFGDERADYEQALKTHYESPVPDWSQTFISSYASSHPWEDWAECWAHYLHMVDGLDTAASWGLQLSSAVQGAAPMQATLLDTNAPSIRAPLLEQWLAISQFVNAMDRSLGLHDAYPFVMVEPVVEKLEFIHRVVRAAAAGEVPMNFSVSG